ncbi:hypothetical protein, partial [Neorhizobium huautlense]|uniref:hypothetical protein n=1 Tax=Neorhizobium huautlense TaxID=67774 RepID=UPI0027D7B8D4
MITPENMLICVFSYNVGSTLHNCIDSILSDLPLKFHPAAIRALAFFDKPNGVVGATSGNV